MIKSGVDLPLEKGEPRATNAILEETAIGGRVEGINGAWRSRWSILGVSTLRSADLFHRESR
jgi:hypothetical protein